MPPDPRPPGPPPPLLTSGRIAGELREPLHRVLNVLATRPHIRPSAFAGNLRLYDRRAVAMVRHELNAIDARRCNRRVGGGGRDPLPAAAAEGGER